jgi:hypothetical protein
VKASKPEVVKRNVDRRMKIGSDTVIVNFFVFYEHYADSIVLVENLEFNLLEWTEFTWQTLRNSVRN